ncbi:radical SAM protein [Candidatus Latescibacterota bacterium]
MLPGYVKLLETGEYSSRIESLKKHYYNCKLCPHKCGVNRMNGDKGKCRSGFIPVVASSNLHFGEEPPISGIYGSGTIFFSGCSGKCIFCQNYPISQIGTGNEITEEQLAGMMLNLSNRGCNNINFVTPTHFLPSIVSALFIAATKGLEIPIVYNTSGYERPKIIKLLDGIIDIYLPDSKYSDDDVAREISGFTCYVENNRSSLIEMFNQVGNLQTKNDIALKGLIVRHLILPGNLSGTGEVLKFLSENISPDIYISLMDQFFPVYKSLKHKILSKRISPDEYNNAIDIFYENGLHNGWIQDHTQINDAK